AKLYQLQEKLYADGSQSLLIVIQAMDAAGKDSLIQHVMSGINTQGCEVTSFKTPSSKEYIFYLVWRFYLALDFIGIFGIFYRCHYDCVLLCKFKLLFVKTYLKAFLTSKKFCYKPQKIFLIFFYTSQKNKKKNDF
ncbi:hypothetical protein GNY06_00505, partial [Elizabethkingia argentiflava]|nr:hypothetical protein [Elizabethkingia argenteiflava]